jgi:hypothetical protein
MNGLRSFTAAAVVAVLLIGCQKANYNWRALKDGTDKHRPPVYPIAISDDRRYFVDAKGAPFLLHGDAPWSLITGLTESEAEVYLEDRRQKGFNAILVNLIEHKFNGPANRAGQEPFPVRGDFGVMNQDYFGHADRVIRKAGEKGVLVILAPCYLGAAGTDEGWYEEVLANGVEKTAAYVRTVVQRYARYDNVVWMLVGDRNPGRALPHVEAMAAAVKEVDARHLVSAHMAPERSTRDVFPRSEWVAFNLAYT